MVDVYQVKAVAAFAVATGGGGAPVDHAVIATLGGPYLPDAALVELAGDIATVLLRETARPALPAPIGTAQPGPVAFVDDELRQLGATAPGTVLAACEAIASACQSPDYADSMACRLLGVIRRATIGVLSGTDDLPALRGAA